MSNPEPERINLGVIRTFRSRILPGGDIALFLCCTDRDAYAVMAGTGTTHVAAKRLSRRYLGAEIGKRHAA
jgi:hypothetical protein